MNKTITANGYDFSYVEAGDGPPVVFIHGSLLDYRYWNREISYFSKSFRTIAMSRRHHWPSVTEGHFSYDAIAQTDDMIAFLVQLVAGPVHLVGHSYGGYLATGIACVRPDLVLSLTLVEPGGPVVGQAPGISMHADFKLAADMIVQGEKTQGVSHFMDTVCAERKWADSSEEIQSIALANATTLTEQIKEARPSFARGELSRINFPVLLILGELSHSPFPETLERFYELIPTAEKVVIPDASHLVSIDNFTAFAHALDSFLTKV